MAPELHDSVLELIEIDWVRQNAKLTFRRSGSVVEAVVRASQSLRLPRDEPWGPSSSVNAVDVVALVGDRVSLRVEMQSGDTLIIDGASVDWSV